MSVEQNKATLHAAAEAFNDPKARLNWFDIHDPSVVAHGLGPQPLDFRGMKEFYHSLWEGFPDLTIAVEDMVGEGDEVAWRLAVKGTHQAKFRGVPATGKQVNFAAQYIFRFSGGKVVERWTNLDRLGVLVQLGAVAAPA